MAEKWFAYCPEAQEIKIYEDKEALEKDSLNYLSDNYLDGDSGWSDQVHYAFAGYGNVKPEIEWEDSEQYEKYLKTLRTHTVREEILDEQKNYPNEEGEEWPYSSDFDYIAGYFFTEIKQDGEQQG